MDAPKQYTLRVEADGKLELPAEFRAEFNLEAGDMVTVIHIDGHLIIAPRPLIVSEMADKIAELVEQAGLTVEDLIEAGHQVGARLFEEQYGGLVR